MSSLGQSVPLMLHLESQQVCNKKVCVHQGCEVIHNQKELLMSEGCQQEVSVFSQSCESAHEIK